MKNVFDLSRVSQLVENNCPARILILDTNIIMNASNADDWRVTADGQNLYILSDTIIQELELISQKGGSKEKLDSRDKARKATMALTTLFSRGTITAGIAIKSGWIIGLPSPIKELIDQEIDQYEDIAKAFHRSDTKLLLLTRECHQLFQSVPVTLVTADRSLHNIVEMQGIPCKRYTGFPIEGLKEAPAITRPINWEQEFAGIQTNIVKNSIVAEATLSSQSVAPSWLKLLSGTKQFVIAEGRGIVRVGEKVKPFVWTIPFYPQSLDSRLSDENEGLTDLPSIYIDLLGEDDLEQDYFDAIADRLVECTSISFEEGRPTLQNPESVTEALLYYEYIAEHLDEQGIPGVLAKLRKEIEESEGLIHYWTDWILNKEDESEKYACLEGLIVALNNCWKIGQTYTFSIITEQK